LEIAFGFNYAFYATGLKMLLPNKEYGVPVNETDYNEIAKMFRTMGVSYYAMEFTLSKLLRAPFSYKIPHIGMQSSDDQNKHHAQFWMPELRKVMRWVRAYGVCPVCWKMVGEKKVPMIPDFCQGLPWVHEDLETHEKRFYWFWKNVENAAIREPEKDILWVRTVHEPDADGSLQSAGKSLLNLYRSYMYKQVAEDEVVQSRARPTHLIVAQHRDISAQDDNLTTFNAPFSDVAGLPAARREARKEQLGTNKMKNVFRRMMWQKEKFQGDSVPIFYSDLPDTLLLQSNPNFVEKCIPITEGFNYVKPAQAEVVADCAKAKEAFDREAAVVFDFAPELVFSGTSSHVQAVKGAQQFQSDRLQQMSSFLIPVIQGMLIYAFKESIDEFFTQVNYQLNDGSDEIHELIELYPELDMQVELSTPTLADADEMRNYLYDGIISKDEYAEHVYETKNMSGKNKRVREWPDRVPRELFVKEHAETKKNSLMSGKKNKKK
jgi:hypothetical protein